MVTRTWDGKISTQCRHKDEKPPNGIVSTVARTQYGFIPTRCRHKNDSTRGTNSINNKNSKGVQAGARPLARQWRLNRLCNRKKTELQGYLWSGHPSGEDKKKRYSKPTGALRTVKEPETGTNDRRHLKDDATQSQKSPRKHSTRIDSDKRVQKAADASPILIIIDATKMAVVTPALRSESGAGQYTSIW